MGLLMNIHEADGLDCELFEFFMGVNKCWPNYAESLAQSNLVVVIFNISFSYTLY